MKIDLSVLEIRLLLRCAQGLLSKSALTQISRSAGKKNKEKAMETLIKRGYVFAKKLPRLDAKKTPVFYEITSAGQKWIDAYMIDYPKDV